MMGVDMVVACVFEFFAYFIVDYFVRLVGHAGIMYVGLLGYALRFVVYAAIRNPWTVLPVETLQGQLLQLSVFLYKVRILCIHRVWKKNGPIVFWP